MCAANEITHVLLQFHRHGAKTFHLNDVHHAICVHLLENAACRANIYLDPTPTQSDFDILHQTTGHAKHVLVDAPAAPANASSLPANPPSTPQSHHSDWSVELLGPSDNKLEINDKDDEKLVEHALSMFVVLIFCPLFISGLTKRQQVLKSRANAKAASLHIECITKEHATEDTAIVLDDDNIIKEIVTAHVQAEIKAATKVLCTDIKRIKQNLATTKNNSMKKPTPQMTLNPQALAALKKKQTEVSKSKAKSKPKDKDCLPPEKCQSQRIRQRFLQQRAKAQQRETNKERKQEAIQSTVLSQRVDNNM